MTGIRRLRACRWTEDDDNLLRSMAQAGKSLTIMTVKLNRPTSAIKSRAHDRDMHIAGTEIRARRKR